MLYNNYIQMLVVWFVGIIISESLIKTMYIFKVQNHYKMSYGFNNQDIY